MPDFLELSEVSAKDLRLIIDDARKVKIERNGKTKGLLDAGTPLADHVVALIFEKNSTRTRLSFDVGVRQMGGQSIVLASTDLQRSRGETIKDTAQVLSRYVDLIMIRTFADKVIREMAEHASVPVINGLTDYSHPCQIMADVMTFEEKAGPIKGKTVVWVGTGNNVCNSFLHAAGQFGFNFVFCGPEGFDPDQKAVSFATSGGGAFVIDRNPFNCVRAADMIVTDAWISMHEEAGGNDKQKLHAYQVNQKLLSHARPDVLFMHCMPAHREEEVTSEVLDGPNSVILDEVENRLHVQKSIMKWCLGLL
ncbi:MAG: ornithine carbamoyltransferase [Rhodobacteraceae bacterium]|nr:ornithine carbamoyltransferase [Paracoccaceae bacterium]MCY4251600.1 ornithine carbamoyltransferase [Paracoccaceae bacterium]